MDNQTPLQTSVEVDDIQAENKEDLAALLRANLAMTKEIQAMVKHINTYVAWQRLFGWIKLILIIIPLIIGVIYLPPLIRDYYQQLLQTLGSGLAL